MIVMSLLTVMSWYLNTGLVHWMPASCTTHVQSNLLYHHSYFLTFPAIATSLLL